MESIARLVALVVGHRSSSSPTAWSVFTALVVPRVTSSRVHARCWPASWVVRRRRLAAEAAQLRGARPGPVLRRPGRHGAASSSSGSACSCSGSGCIIWWSSGVDFATALGIAGSSVFTLGIASASDAGPETLEIIAAGIGLLVIALEIAYLPALYNAVRHPRDGGDAAWRRARGPRPGAPRSWPGTTCSTPWTSCRRSTRTGSAGPPPCRRATPTTPR